MVAIKPLDKGHNGFCEVAHAAVRYNIAEMWVQARGASAASALCRLVVEAAGAGLTWELLPCFAH